MTKRLVSCFIIAIGGFMLFSCVPLKQFQDLQEQQKMSKEEMQLLRSENQNSEVINNELQSDIDRLRGLVEQLEKDTMRLAKENWSLRKRNKQLSAQYSEYLNSFTGGNVGKDSKELLAHLQSLHEQLQAREDDLIQSEKELAIKQKNLSDAQNSLDVLQSELDNRNRRLNELEKALSEKDSLMNALRKSVADALTGFNDDELAVHIKNGKVYVSMEEKLLFGSGSYQVSDAGVQALKKISGVLAQKKDINILVEGHTDDVPYKSGVLLDNWDLSVKRATSVIRILLQNNRIEASRISAAGRGEFVPLDNSKTADARRKNRRTEIILSPKLDQIFNILETN